MFRNSPHVRVPFVCRRSTYQLFGVSGTRTLKDGLCTDPVEKLKDIHSSSRDNEHSYIEVPGFTPDRHHELTEWPFPSRLRSHAATETGARCGFRVSSGASTDGLGPTFDCHRSKVTRPYTPAAVSQSSRMLTTSAGPFVSESTNHSGCVSRVYQLSWPLLNNDLALFHRTRSCVEEVY